MVNLFFWNKLGEGIQKSFHLSPFGSILLRKVRGLQFPRVSNSHVPYNPTNFLLTSMKTSHNKNILIRN